MFRTVAATAALALIAMNPAAAQEAQPVVAAPAAEPAPAPPPIQAPPAPSGAVEEGDRLIAAANAQAFFVNESKATGGVRLRHAPSGMTCIMSPGRPTNAITVFPGSPPGDNVACTIQTSLAMHTFYATRAQQGVDLDDSFKMAVAALRSTAPGAKPIKPSGDRPSLLSMLTAKMPPMRTAVFRVDGGFTRVSLIVIDGWELKARISSPIEQGVTGLGDVAWLGAIGEAALREKK